MPHTHTHTRIRRGSKFSTKSKTKDRLELADTRHQSTWELRAEPQPETLPEPEPEPESLPSNWQWTRRARNKEAELEQSLLVWSAARCGLGCPGKGEEATAGRQREAKRSLEPNCSTRTWSQRTYRAADELRYLTSLTTAVQASDGPTDRPPDRPPDRPTGLQFARSIAVKAVVLAL